MTQSVTPRNRQTIGRLTKLRTTATDALTGLASMKAVYFRTPIVAVLLSALLSATPSLAGDLDYNQRSHALKLARYTQRMALPSGNEASVPPNPNDGNWSGQYLGSTSSAANLGCNPGTPDAVRGIAIGCTTYDYQKNNSMNRQIGITQPSHVLYFTWTKKLNTTLGGPRAVGSESWNPVVGGLSDGGGGVDISARSDSSVNGRAGFVTLDVTSSELVINAHHWNAPSPPGTQPHVFINNTTGLSDFIEATVISSTLWQPFLTGDATVYLWPAVAHGTDGVNDVTHLLIHSTRTDGDGDVLYLRKVGAGASGTWSTPFSVGLGGYNTSPVIVASRNSAKVGIAASFARGDGTKFGPPISRYNGFVSGQIDNDLYYMTSNDGGATWGPLTNVTRNLYPAADSAGFYPDAKLTALWDSNDNFQIVWNAGFNDGSGFILQRSRLFQYDVTSDNIHTVFDASWDQTRCTGGVFNLNTTNPQLSECNSKLYVTFEQFNDVPNGIEDDCSERGFASGSTDFAGAANGEIFVTVSSNNGLTWDRPRNLTNTYTPDCDTIVGGLKPDCDSDVWHSTTRYGIDAAFDNFASIADLTPNIDAAYAADSFLFVQYINDADAGGAIRPEGGWTTNPVRVFRFGCVEPILEAILGSSLPGGQAIDDPAFALPGATQTLPWNLVNFGNTDLTYSLQIINQNPPGNLSITGATGLIVAGISQIDTLGIVLNTGLETTVQHASAAIIATGNFISSPDTFLIDYTIGDVELLTFDSLNNCLVIANNGNIGAENNTRPGILTTAGGGRLNMDFAGDPAECDTTGNANSYLFDGSPVISYNGGQVVSGMFDFSIADTFQFRPLTMPFADNNPAGDPLYLHANSGEFTTQDSTLGFNVDYWAPDPSIAPPGPWKVVIGRACFYNLSASPIDSVFCAFAWDWDVPSDSGSRNTSTISGARSLIYQQGSEFGQDTGNTACQLNDNRFAGTIYVPPSDVSLPGYTDGGSGVMGVGFQGLFTRDNGTFVAADWRHPLLDSILHTITGFSKFSSSAPDSQEVDLFTVLNGGAYRIDPDDTLYLWFKMVTGIGTQTQFLACVDSARGLGNPLSSGCCVTAGDYTNDGSFNIADVTAGISRIFSGGPPPSCQDQADANGDNTFNIADVTFGIARIFSGGPPPICGTTGM